MKSYWLRVLVSLDQTLATIFLPSNSEDCTISDWAWRHQNKPMIAVIDSIFGKGHCQNSFEADE